MKKLFLIGCLLLNMTYAAEIEQIRNLFATSSTIESNNNKLIELTKPYSLTQNPLYYAYRGAGIMSLANHTYWPISKLNYFNKGKEMVEAAVKNDSKNVEIRFIRYSIQKNSPSFLGYYGNLETDRNFILNNLDRTGWSESYKQKVKNSLSS